MPERAIMCPRCDCAWVLVVDDDEDIREAITTILDCAGYQVVPAANGLAALEILNGRDSRPCLVFLDLMMPVMTGHEMLRSLSCNERLSNIPVCILTALPERAPMGAVRVLRKPFNLDDLLEVVGKECSRSLAPDSCLSFSRCTRARTPSL